MEVYRIKNEEARNYLLLRHGLLGHQRYDGKFGALAYIKDIGSIQQDPIDICGKNAEILLHSRISGFRKNDLDELLYEDRLLIDYFDKNLSIMPIEDFSYFHLTKRHHRENGRSQEEISAVKSVILETIREKRFVSAKDFEFDQKVDWYWNASKLSRAALEQLYYCGELLIHHKQKNKKFYTLPEVVLDDVHLAEDKNLFQSEEDYYQWQVKRRISNVGMLWNKGSDAWLGMSGFKAGIRNLVFEKLILNDEVIQLHVENVEAPFYILQKDMHFLQEVLEKRGFPERLEFLAPLDSVLWDRKMIAALFDFDYKWEIYTPILQRTYGHYVLPILYGNRLIGRVEFIADRKNAHLSLKNLWLEDGVSLDRTIQTEMNRSIERFSMFNHCQTWDAV